MNYEVELLKYLSAVVVTKIIDNLTVKESVSELH